MISSYKGEPRFYVLRGTRPVRATPSEFDDFFEHTQNRRLALTKVNTVTISTVFLGVDQCPKRSGLLFESALLIEKKAEGLWRYRSWEEAIDGHNSIVNQVINAANIPVNFLAF